MTRRPCEAVTAEDIGAMGNGLRRYAAARRIDPMYIDDLVQETIARLLEVRDRLDRPTSFAYGMATLTNLERSRQRGEDIAHRHRHRLIDLDAPIESDDPIIRREEVDALRRALDGLPAPMHALLVEQYSSDLPGPPMTGAHSARLTRARARLRLEYLLALRKLTVTDRCRSVLLAISARDVRRQTEVGAGRHLTTCQVCVTLADPLAARDARLFALWPFLGAAALVRTKMVSHPVTATATAAVLVGATGTAIAFGVASTGPTPRPGTPSVAQHRDQGVDPDEKRTGDTGSDSRRHAIHAAAALCRGPGAIRCDRTGDRLFLRRVAVTAVPVDEAFVVRLGPGVSVWVALKGPGESPESVTTRDRATMTGTVRPLLASGLPQDLAPTLAKGVLRSGFELRVSYRDLDLAAQK